jgi:hypothetical protein
MEALRKKGKTTKIGGFMSFIPPLNANVLFCWFSLNLTLCMTKLRVLVLSFSYLMENLYILRTSSPSYTLV